MFLKNCWYIAAQADEVGRALLHRRIVGEPVVMYRTEAGMPVAFLDRCAHRSLPLSKGTLIGDTVQCGYHGMTYGADGRCVAAPGYETPPDHVRVRAFPLVEKWTYLWIWMGDPALADEDALPDFHWPARDGWTPCPGYLRIGAHYQLLLDNLLDLSHETYVHGATIGNEAVAEALPETFEKDGQVVVSRFMPSVPAPPMHVKVRGFTGAIDRHQHVFFIPPSFIDIDSRFYVAGTEDEDTGIVWRVLNGLTPETETSTHYFWNLPRGFSPGDPEMTALLHQQVTKTFEEDRGVLEAQQQMLTEDPGFEHANIPADAGPILARRLVARLLEAEAAVG